MRHLPLLSAVILLFALSGMTVMRSSVFLSDTAMWTDAAAKSPNKARPHNNLGHALKEIGKFDLASSCFERALALDPLYPDALNNLAIMYNQQGRRQDTLSLLKRGLELNPGHLQARYNLAMQYYEMGMLIEAEKEYALILELGPYSKEALFARKMLQVIRQAGAR